MTEGIFQFELEELRQMDLHASNAPWATEPPPGVSPSYRRRIDRIYQGGSEIVAAAVGHGDANLIVLFRNMLPRILATMDRYRQILEQVKGTCTDVERFDWRPDPRTGAPARRFIGCSSYRNEMPSERCVACEAYAMIEQLDAVPVNV